MSDLSPDQIHRLNAALQTFDRPDGVARARLLAALTAECPPAVQLLWQARFNTMRKIGIRLSMAAVLVMMTVGLWHATQPRSVFARAAQAMVQAKGFRCDLREIHPHPESREDSILAGHEYWSPTGGTRSEHLMKNSIEMVVISRPGQRGISLRPQTQQYQILPKKRDEEFSSGLFSHLGELNAPIGPPVSTEEIEGRRADKYELPWSLLVGPSDHKDARLRLWLDTTTHLPVRVDLLDILTTRAEFLRFDNFRWGDQEVSLFDATPPQGYAQLPTQDFRAEKITEHVVFGLKTFAKYNHGRYPAVKYVYGDEQGEALRTLIGLGPKAQGWVGYDKNLRWNDPKEGEFAFGSSAMGWINSLQRENPDCAYHGKTVTPQDADKVLLRWKLDDGTYRVIFGDLKSATVSADRLKELEAK